MLELFVSACFSAFFLAVIDQLVDLKMLKALVSVVLSGVSLYLLGVSKMSVFIVYAVAAAFVSLFITVAADRMTTFKPAVIRPIRPEQ